MKEDIFEIRWHGRGGQGAITAAKIIANAAFAVGFGGVVMAPTFGTERRGAPVLTSLKISKQKIFDLSPITEPHMVVVLDHLIVEEVEVTDGLRPGGTLIINSPMPPEAYDFKGIRIVTADVTSIAAAAGLPKGIVNTGIIGAFAKAGNLINLEALTGAIEAEFKGKNAKKNADAARITYSQTRIGGE